MYNLNSLINEAKVFFGMNIVGVLDLNEQDFIRCLEEKTLPEFSVYVPFYFTHTINPYTDEIPCESGRYFIKGTPTRIIGVNKMLSPDYIGGFGDYQYTSSHAGSLGDMVDNQMSMDRYSAGSVTPTGRFYPPNIFEIYPKEMAQTNITIELKLVHPISCVTIPAGSYRRLKELFLTDLSRDILSSREFFSGLTTIHGSIEMNLDRIRTQADKYDELVSQLEENILKNSNVQKLYIA